MLVKATLLRRYKRFLADVRLADGRECTVHCPNPGAMTGLCEAGASVWLRLANKGNKLPYRWQIVQTPTALVGIDTGLANSVVAQALSAQYVPALAMYTHITAEKRLSTLNMSDRLPPSLLTTRLDFCLSRAEQSCVGETYFLEVKSVTLRNAATAQALFPDSRTARGLKHLHSLIALRTQGFGAGIFYVIQRDDCDSFDVASQIDPDYAKGYTQAMEAGVDVMAWDCKVTPEYGVRLRRPVQLG